MNKNKFSSLLILLLIALPYFGFSQDFSQKMGKVKATDFKVDNLIDEDPEAIVLFDIGKTSFQHNYNAFDAVFERKTRIKVLSDAGNKWANVEIPFYSSGKIKEKVYDIEAYSFNLENGKVKKTRLVSSNIFEEQLNNSWFLTKFAIPNVKPGTIIEYTYKIKSPDVFNLRDWEFQWKIPVVQSAYEIKMIPYYSYVYIAQGTNQFDREYSFDNKKAIRLGNQEYIEKVYQFIMEEVPAFKSEDFITSIDDYIVKVSFQLSSVNPPDGPKRKVFTTWDNMNEELLDNKHFGYYIKQSKKYGNRLFKSDEFKALNNLEKFNHVVDYVKQNYRWNHGYGKYTSQTADDFANKKYGNAADINLFTIGVLQGLGIDAKPVILSTRSNGKILQNYPLSSYFNYVAILVNFGNTSVLSDATEVNLANTRIPLRCINEKGLIVDKKKVNWVTLNETPFVSEIRKNISMDLTDDHNLNIKTHLMATEYDAIDYRNEYQEGGLKSIKEDLENDNFELAESSIEIQNEKDKNLPLTLVYEETGKAESINDKLYISPFTNSYINPLKEKERNYPIDLGYPIKRINQSHIKIPDGYEIDYLPENKVFDNDLFQFSYKVNQKENEVEVIFGYTFKKSVYKASEYGIIQSFFNDITEKGNDKIVLQKKS